MSQGTRQGKVSQAGGREWTRTRGSRGQVLEAQRSYMAGTGSSKGRVRSDRGVEVAAH